MTERGVYENILIEIRKVKAPSLHLEDYLYWANKGIQEYCNERYNKFEINQQLSDDLGALLTADSFVIVNATTGYFESDPTTLLTYKTGNRYNSDFIQFTLPINYWHMLGANVTNYTKFNYKCHPAGYTTTNASKKLSTQHAQSVIDNSYLKPLFSRPYHGFSTKLGVQGVLDILFYIGDLTKAGVKSVYIDYLRKPARINLTKAQVDAPLDTTNIIEFPEYVCNEIIKRTVKLILESSGDPRLNTNVPINTSIQ